MSGPPAPPPPPPPPSIVPGTNSLSSKKNDDSTPTPAPSVMLNRDALLGQIRQGITLKKAETNDRSAPQISGGGVVSSPSSISKSSNNNNNTAPSMSAPPVPQLGDLLAGGFPKLKHVNPNLSNPTAGSAPPVPNLQVPSIPKRRPSKGKVTTPNVPTNRPVGKSHQKKSSISYEAPPLPTTVPPAPTGAPPIPTGAPPIPTSVPSAPITVTPSSAAPPPPPPPPPAMPTLAAPPIPTTTTTTTDTPHIKKQSISTSSPISPPPPPPQPSTFVVPSIPNTSVSSETSIPLAPQIPISSSSTASSIPSAPPIPTIPAPSASSTPSVPSVPPPPPIMPNVPTSKEKSTIKHEKSSKSNSPTNTPVVGGGPLPFLAEIQKKRDDRFVVSQDSNYSTYVEQEPVTQSNSISSPSISKPATGATGGSMSFLSEIESKMKTHSHSNVDISKNTHPIPTKAPPLPSVAPPLPSVAPPLPSEAPPIPSEAPPIPSSTANPLAHNDNSSTIHDSSFSFANEISSQILNYQKLHHGRIDNEPTESIKPSIPLSTPPSVLSTTVSPSPPVTSAPPLSSLPPPAPTVPAPPAPPAIPSTLTPPVVSSVTSIPASVAQTSAPNRLNQQVHSSHAAPPPPPSSSKGNTTNNDTTSVTATSNDSGVATSSTSSAKHRLFASEGSFSSTKIDPSAYTISGSSTTSKISNTANNNTNSESLGSSSGSKVKIMIDDSRFNWSINESQMPAPRKFQNVTKLYPSGGGSTIPLDLSLYE